MQGSQNIQKFASQSSDKSKYRLLDRPKRSDRRVARAFKQRIR